MVKETKLYDLLGLSPSASEADIKKGYKKAALKYHPDKPSGDPEKFKEVGEAFDILSNSEKKQLYDNYGLESARRGVPMDDSGGAAGFGGGGSGGGGGNPFSFSAAPGQSKTWHFSADTGGGGGPQFQSAFSSDDAFNIFRQFGAAQGFDDDDDDIFSMLGGGRRRQRPRGGGGGAAAANGMPGGMPGGFGMPGGMPDGMSGSSPPQQPKSSFQIKLPVSLRDLATGTMKKMKIKRRRMQGAEEKVLQVQIKPGWKAGTKITYANEGDLQSDGSLQDIVFIVEEKPDAVFKRVDNDLEQSITLSLKEALCGFERIVETIDNKRIRVSYSSPVSPGQQVRYPGNGMPISKKPGEKGDLVINIKVDFPASLTPAQRQAIEQTF